ncbi:MAG: AAA family ATPase [Candidatus Marinimicrobia bacterium]|nr:AAA family ATPase [Candidatus Neomarinimicrobiota bacterium]
MIPPALENQIVLSEEQTSAVNLAFEWFQKVAAEKQEYKGDPKDFTLSQPIFQFTGFAGTGKTTTINSFVNLIHIRPLYAAYTGKAALVMHKVNGVPASTIHSLIYNYVKPDREACEVLYSEIHETPPTKSPEELQQMAEELKSMSAPGFQLNPDSKLKNTNLLILDECSMVNQELLDDLLTFGIPILAIGDPGQLPPVQGTGAIFKGEPDVKLIEIHRQAADNPIIEQVTAARKGYPWPRQEAEELELSSPFFCVNSYKLSGPQLKSICLNADQILTNKNATRLWLNSKVREWLGFDITDRYPQIGERLCCWKNDKESGLLNGLMAEVVGRGEVYDEYIELFIRTELMDNDQEPLRIKSLLAYYDAYYEPDAMSRVKGWQRKHNQEFDFGYCLTVHKAQGSQWVNVVYYDDGMLKGWPAKAKERRQLVYTAGTRAAERLHCIIR